MWPGYYYWDGSKWVRLLSAESQDWRLDGNSNGALRYIGTNDNYDFPIRTNGIELEFSSTLTLYKDMDKMVIMDARITKESQIVIEGLSGYQITDQKEGSFTILLGNPLPNDVTITYKSQYR